jgi:vancomycin resistance protein VanJ
MTARQGTAGTGVVRRLLRALVIVCAIAYPIALLVIILMLRYIGEQWWVTLTALYLPRIGFALPLPIIAALLWWLDAPRRYVALQLVSVYLLLFPLMGLRPGPGRPLVQPSGPVIQVMSFNIKFASSDSPRVLAQAREFGADVVLMQDAGGRGEPAWKQAWAGWNVRADGEFVVATRHAIRDAYVPPALVYPQGTGGAHFVRYTLETPLGLVDVFNVHPTSPRPGLEEVRGNGLREEILSGRLLEAGITEQANASSRAVIIAGDTNLPGLSRILGEHLGRYRDAFSQAGRGFGYTFPSRRPWMRIDRVLTNDRLRALDFRVGDAALSDHGAVFAVLLRQRD